MSMANDLAQFGLYADRVVHGSPDRHSQTRQSDNMWGGDLANINQTSDYQGNLKLHHYVTEEIAGITSKVKVVSKTPEIYEQTFESVPISNFKPESYEKSLLTIGQPHGLFANENLLR